MQYLNAMYDLDLKKKFYFSIQNVFLYIARVKGDISKGSCKHLSVIM